MHHDRISALMGLGGAILLLLGLQRVIFSPVDFESVPLYFGLGGLAVQIAFIGAGAALLYFSIRRAKRTMHIKA